MILRVLFLQSNLLDLTGVDYTTQTMLELLYAQFMHMANKIIDKNDTYRRTCIFGANGFNICNPIKMHVISFFVIITPNGLHNINRLLKLSSWLLHLNTPAKVKIIHIT